MNVAAPIGHNMPPDPIDDVTAPYDASRSEAESWLDGKAVETEGQMKAVDVLRGEMRAWRLGLEAGQKAATTPLHEVYKSELERWKPTIADAKMIEAGLVGLVDGFKRKLAAEKDAARKAAEHAAWEATRAAQAAARLADATDIEATRAAAKAADDAEAAQRAAMAASKDTVKGLRTVTKYEILDHRALLNFIAKNARDDMTAFIEDWARKNHKQFTNADGLKVWTEKEAF